MKVWVETGIYDVFIHLKEPKGMIPGRLLWTPKGKLLYCYKGSFKRLFGMKRPTPPELYELDLSSTKPRLVCVWVPV
jgi:hypothetical protein